MPIFDEHKIRVERHLNFDIPIDNREEFTNVYHITHIPAAKHIFEADKISARLVYDSSKLNSERITVIWLSPNSWGQGSLYGNIRFTFDFNTLIANKHYYAVEVMGEYNPDACRILISDKEYEDSELLTSYEPRNKYDGPWHFDEETQKHYYLKGVTIEFMFEEGISISNSTKIDCVSHHNEYCNITRQGNCNYLGSTAELSEVKLTSHLIANDIVLPNLKWYIEAQLGGFGLLHTVNILNKTLSIFNGNVLFNGPLLSTDTGSIELGKSILELIAKENIESAKTLSSIFVSYEALTSVLKSLYSSYFNVDTGRLDIEVLLDL